MCTCEEDLVGRYVREVINNFVEILSSSYSILKSLYKMAHIVPDVMYEKILCSQCSKYLSVFPVKVYHGGIMKCGRCCSYNDGGTISLYTKVMEIFLFKCINRYEDCRQLLKPSDVFSHEQTCVGGDYQCQECHLFNGTAYELIEHYRKMHPSRLVSENECIKIVINAKDLDCPTYRNYLMIKDEIICVIMTRLFDKKFEFSVALLKEYPDIKYNCVLFTDGDSSLKNSTWKGKKCVSLGQFQSDKCIVKKNFRTVTSITFLPKLNINTFNYIYSIASNLDAEKRIAKSEEKPAQSCTSSIDICTEGNKPALMTNQFKRTFPGYKLSSCGTALITPNGETIELLCSNCGECYGIYSYKCEKEHLLCRDCKNYCSICEQKSLSHPLNEDYTEKLLLLLFNCKWPLCNEYIEGFQKMNHEYNCKLAILKCPTCEIILPFPKLKLHVSEIHQSKIVECQVNEIAWNCSVYFLKNCHVIEINTKIDNLLSCTVSSPVISKGESYFGITFGLLQNQIEKLIYNESWRSLFPLRQQSIAIFFIHYRKTHSSATNWTKIKKYIYQGLK